jgi:hypothetical protein
VHRCLSISVGREGTAGNAAEAARHSGVVADFGQRFIDEEEDEVTRDSNAVVDLVHLNKLDEAERVGRELLERCPEVHDGYDRLGMVYEARGDRKQAAECYRRVIGF